MLCENKSDIYVNFEITETAKISVIKIISHGISDFILTQHFSNNTGYKGLWIRKTQMLPSGHYKPAVLWNHGSCDYLQKTGRISTHTGREMS